MVESQPYLSRRDLFLLLPNPGTWTRNPGPGNERKLAFSWRGTKKTKKTKDFGVFRPRHRPESQILFFFGFFWYLLKKWQRFPPKACIFLEGYQKNKKNQRFWSLQASPSPRVSNLVFFFGFFWYLLKKWQRFPPKACIFLEGYQKNPKKNKDFGLFRPRPDFFGFFWYLLRKWQRFPPKACIFLGGTKKNKKTTKILDSSGLAFAKTLKSLVFLVFLVPPQEIATFSTKSLHFPGGVPKKPKNNKDFGLFRRRVRQDSKIFGFFCFFGTSSRNGNVFHQKLAFSWGVPKKPKNNKDFGLFRRRVRQDSKIFVFFDFLVPPQEMATFPFLAILPAHCSIL